MSAWLGIMRTLFLIALNVWERASSLQSDIKRALIPSHSWSNYIWKTSSSDTIKMEIMFSTYEFRHMGKSCMCVLSCFSHVRLFVTLWTAACKAPLPMGFSMKEYWSGLPFPSPGDLPNPGIKAISLKFTCLGRQVLYH